MAVLGNIISADPDNIDAVLELNVTAVTRLAAAVVRNFMRRKAGIIINLGSVTALLPE